MSEPEPMMTHVLSLPGDKKTSKVPSSLLPNSVNR